MHKIKRYANRKLYDTTDKKYITLDQISKLIKGGQKISVVDNQTGKDLTAVTVSQCLARDRKKKGTDVGHFFSTGPFSVASFMELKREPGPRKGPPKTNDSFKSLFGIPKSP